MGRPRPAALNTLAESVPSTCPRTTKLVVARLSQLVRPRPPRRPARPAKELGPRLVRLGLELALAQFVAAELRAGRQGQTKDVPVVALGHDEQ